MATSTFTFSKICVGRWQVFSNVNVNL